jgi:D-sedoheptulose 7-phosphate isomerase
MEHCRMSRPTTVLLDDLFSRYPALNSCMDSINQAFLIFKNTFLNGKKILVCGNGGSAADAEHFSGELVKGFLKKRPLPQSLEANLQASAGNNQSWIGRLQGALAVYPLTVNGALNSAVSNDIGADLIFAQQVLAYGTGGDSILAISTSGNSDNICKAVMVAAGLGMDTVGLTGSSGGCLDELCEVTIRVPASQVCQVQELHLPIYHTLAAMLEEEFFGPPVETEVLPTRALR